MMEDNEEDDNRTPFEEYLDAVIDIRKESGEYEDDCVTLKQDSLSLEKRFKADWLLLMTKYRATVYGTPDGSRSVVIVDDAFNKVTEFYI